VIARFGTQLRTRKPFTFDDAFLLIGLASLIAALVVFHVKVLEPMYLIYALILQTPGVVPPPLADLPRISDEFRLYVTVTLVLCWCTIMAVKLSFMFFFKRLIDRIWNLKVYWWVVLVYNVGVLGYGASVYYIACPYTSGDPRGCKFSLLGIAYNSTNIFTSSVQHNR
jgi:hypothetical protein